jgi:hypothetical protein
MLYEKFPLLKSDCKDPMDMITFAFSMFSLMTGSVIEPT